jgi:Dolichyl-phosphate-mannose-protein mannosyltransferase
MPVGVRDTMARVSHAPGLKHAALWWWLVVLVTVGVPLAIRFRIGPIPENDDWSYLKSALAMHHGDGVELQGFAQMFLIGQLVAVQPLLWVFGDRIGAFDVFGALAAVAWLWLVFVTVRRVVDSRRALLLVCVAAAWPGLGLLSTSFMTDAPFAALCWAQLYLAVRAFDSGRRLLLVPTFVIALVAFTFREQSIAVAVAVAVYALVHRASPRGLRRFAVAGAVGTVIVCVALEHLRRNLPHADVAPYGLSSFDPSGGVNNTVRALFTLGLALSPLVFRFLVIGARHRDQPRRVIIAWVGAVAVGAVLLVLHSHTVLVGNYVSRPGAYSNAVVGTAPEVIDPVVWAVVQAIAIMSTAVLIGAVVGHISLLRSVRTVLDRAAPDRGLPFLFGALLGLLYVGLSFLGERQYDRYLLPVLPIAGLALLRAEQPATRPDSPSRVPAAGTAALVALLYLVGSVLTYSTLVRDRTVWDAATQLTDAGTPATSINAGSDWNGFHAATAVDRGAVKHENDAYLGDFWIQRFPQSSDCYLVTTSPISGPAWHLVSTRSRRPFGFGFGTVTAYTYRRTDHHPFGPDRC